MDEGVLDAELSDEDAEVLDAVLDIDNAAERREKQQLNIAFGATAAFVVVFMLISALWGIADELITGGSEETGAANEVDISWLEPIYMPRHEECIDPNNGQDPDYIGYGVGYEPSLSIDSMGN
ncbi:MAG: hypothetical protein QF885_02515, partial [Candidatus Thalassarchaeaceae archaeon]|nr:hypothetical protein [Candidatus Thalassarchaeaceae archaeon]